MKRNNKFLGYLKLTMLFCFLLISCSKSQETNNTQYEEEDAIVLGKENVLFIGNSHTYFNQGIPSHLAKFRANDNLEFTPIIQEFARGGYTLQDHLSDQGTLDKIKERSWDVLVLQENTFIAEQVLPETIEAMVALSEMVIPKGTKVFLFVTWSYENEDHMLSGIRETYQNGSRATGGKLVPVGVEWQQINQNEEVSVNLYNPDGVHPSLEGTFYATAMFYKAIYGLPPSNNTYNAGLSDEVANYLKTKAD